MRNIESRTQQACVRYFRLQYPRYAGCFFSVPNGGRRDTVTGAILKAEGALAGVADLFLSVPNNVHHGLYVHRTATPALTPRRRQEKAGNRTGRRHSRRR